MDDLAALQHLVAKRIDEKQQSFVDAAAQLGVSGPFLHQFTNGQYKSISVQFAIRLASYIGAPIPAVLRMAGHSDIAKLLEDVNASTDDVYAQQLAAAIGELEPEQKMAIIENARNMARLFKEVKPRYIGGKHDKTKK
ncbi:MAG: hypothetical protein M0Z43_00305 [Acidithiobacillus sp.]|nr:hypothetical protein [Acidithiobacillus sp.]